MEKCCFENGLRKETQILLETNFRSFVFYVLLVTLLKQSVHALVIAYECMQTLFEKA